MRDEKVTPLLHDLGPPDIRIEHCGGLFLAETV